MSEQFKVGDVVVVETCVKHKQFVGREATITEIGMLGRDDMGCRFFACRLDFRLPNGLLAIAKPYQLRKKRPPRRECDEVVSWDDCAWKPKHKEAA